MNSKSSTPHGTQSGAIFNFGNKDKKNQDMDDLQFSTARGSNDEVARPKRVTSFTVNKPKSNESGLNTEHESGLNTERLRENKTIRSNPGVNK